MTPTFDHDVMAALRGRSVLVYCGGSSWEAPPGTDHHLAAHLAEHLPVVYVDPAESVASQVRTRTAVSARSVVEQTGESLFRLRPRTLPGVTRPGLREVAAARTRSAIRRLTRAVGATVTAQVVTCMDDVFVPGLTDVRVLYGTDDFVAGAHLMGISQEWVLRREPRQLRLASHLLAVSEVIAERWRRAGHRVGVLPNGCDAPAFAAVPSQAPVPGLTTPAPRAVVVGQLSERLDLGLLEAFARTGRSLLLVGPAVNAAIATRLSMLAQRGNVEWVGRVPFDQLPQHLAAASVGLTPYVDDAFNRASFPLKTLEYLAAGLPVVSTDLPAARALATTHVAVAAGTRDFVDAAVALLDAPQDSGAVLARQGFAAGHSWEVRATAILETAGLAPVLSAR